MSGNPNPRILGAFLLGLALVGGAYLYGNFGRPYVNYSTGEKSAVVTAALEPRAAIKVEDRDGNGIEDWKDALMNNRPTSFISSNGEPYTPPTSVTGQLGIDLLEQSILAKGYGPIGREQDEVIEQLVYQTNQGMKDTMYGMNDLIIVDDSGDAVRTYGNAASKVLQDNNLPDSRGELFILKGALDNNKPEELNELDPIIMAYKNMSDQFLNTPVPRALAAEHLDLVNITSAIHSDIAGMKLVYEDPVVSLIRLKRYESNASSFGIALQNMALGLEPYSTVFRQNDPAILFVIFHPRFNANPS